MPGGPAFAQQPEPVRASGQAGHAGARAVETAPGGETLTPAQVWELSKLWYHDRLSPEFHGRSVAQAEEIFRTLHLDSWFWYTGRAAGAAQT
jgi:hypothetical protein